MGTQHRFDHVCDQMQITIIETVENVWSTVRTLCYGCPTRSKHHDSLYPRSYLRPALLVEYSVLIRLMSQSPLYSLVYLLQPGGQARRP